MQRSWGDELTALVLAQDRAGGRALRAGTHTLLALTLGPDVEFSGPPARAWIARQAGRRRAHQSRLLTWHRTLRRELARASTRW
jgi:hypothetical protein